MPVKCMEVMHTTFSAHTKNVYGIVNLKASGNRWKKAQPIVFKLHRSCLVDQIW